MGFHPETGVELIPITKEIVETWRQQPTQRCIPKRVDPEKFPFFDPQTREPRVWYWRDKDGGYEFYDCPGFHTRTGQELLVISQEIADEVLGSRRAPNPIDITTYVIFDPNTGAARAWYWLGENVSYEFFDGPGFHPRNGEPLKLFTKEAMQIWEHDIRAERNDWIKRQRIKGHVEFLILSISQRLLFLTPTLVPRARGTGAGKMSAMNFLMDRAFTHVMVSR